MNKKIKMIELLNMIANGQEPPKRIKVKDYNFIWKISENGTGYYNEKEGSGYYWLEDYLSLDNVGDLNTEIEILEDNTEEIEEIDEEWTYIEGQVEKTWSKSELELVNKINELVKAVNSIRKDKNNDQKRNG